MIVKGDVRMVLHGAASGLPRPFWILWIGTLVNRVGGFVLVFLAIYLTEVRGLSVARAGAIVSAYGVGAIGASLAGGVLADRLGRRPTLVGSLMGGAVAMALLGFARTPSTVMAAAALTGLLYELYRPVVSAAVADLVAADDRPRAYSLLYWAVNAGAAVAPILGGVIAARSYTALFVADAATTFAYGVIVWASLPETRPVLAQQHERAEGFGVVVRDGRFVALCALSLATCIVFFQSFAVLPLAVRAHGISTAGFGGLISVNAILIVLLQPFAGEAIRGRSPYRVLALAALLIGAGFGINVWIATAPLYAASVAVWTIGEILFSPASMSLVAELAPLHLRGRYQGAFSIAFSTAFFAAPAVGGWAAGTFGFTTVWIACFVVGVLTTGGFLALGRAASRPVADAVARADSSG
jgi:MFS family permease